MTWDDHANAAVAVINAAPSPATSGTTFHVTSTQGARFPAVANGYECLAYDPTDPGNSETVRITTHNGSSDTDFVMTRNVDSRGAKSILVGWHIAAGVTKKVVTDIEARHAGIVSVSSYGTNNAACQSAVAALSAGNILYFTPGVTYTPSAALSIPAGITVWMYGATITPLTTNQSLFSYQGSGLATDFVGIRFYGGTVEAGAITGIKSIDLKLCRDVIVRNMVFSGTAYSVYADRVDVLRVESSVATGNASQPAGKLKLFATGSVGYCVEPSIVDYTCWNFGNGTPDVAIDLHRTVSVNIQNFSLNDGGTNYGIRMLGDCQGGNITGGVLGKSSFGVIFDDDGSGYAPSFITVNGLQSDQGGAGWHIYLPLASYMHIVNTQLTSSGSGLQVGAACSHISVHNNTFQGLTYGVYVSDSNLHTSINGNKMVTCATPIQIGSSVDYYALVDNDCGLDTNGAILNGSPGATHKTISGNLA